VPKDGFELGEIPAGVQTSKTIELKNLSMSPLFIFNVRACCGAKATLSPMRIEPLSSAKLTLSLKPSVPGLISKQVEIVCDDDENSVVVIPVTGEAVEVYSENLASHWTVLTVLSAGLADGFNPCAFSIVIALAGILAAGGRRKKGRLLGGIAFSLASFLTYMAMGVGLMSALRAMDEMRLARDVFMAALSTLLFILAFLSVRDAFRYRRMKEPSAILLQLPDCVKRLIRSVAEASWSGSAVVASGFFCGFVVTLLDSLCTGQIYVPVLALISRESGGGVRPFALLALYNLAFIAPLITLFVLAALGASSDRLAR
jgi:cytochrome c biogenesis protein CcdA